MSAQLTNVTSKTTLFARVLNGVAALVGLVALFGWIPIETADKVNDALTGETMNKIIAAGSMLLVMILPAIQGWRSKDKELPAGVSVKDVAVKPDAPGALSKASVLNDAARKLSLFVLACTMALGLSACGRASCPRPPVKPLAPPPPPPMAMAPQLAKLLVFAFMGALMIGGLSACCRTGATQAGYPSTNAYPDMKLAQMRAIQGQ